MMKEIACNAMIYLSVDEDMSQSDAVQMVIDKLDEAGVEFNIYETEMREM